MDSSAEVTKMDSQNLSGTFLIPEYFSSELKTGGQRMLESDELLFSDPYKETNRKTVDGTQKVAVVTDEESRREELISQSKEVNRQRDELNSQAKDVMLQIGTLTDNNGSTTISQAVRSQIQEGLRSITERHGVPRVAQVFEILTNASPSKNLLAYGVDLRAGNNPELTQERANRLRNIDWLCEPGNAERFSELDQQMRRERFRGTMQLQHINANTVDMLRNDHDERQAYIEFNDETRESMMPLVFLGERRDVGNMRPTELMRAYRQWLDGRRNR